MPEQLGEQPSPAYQRVGTGEIHEKEEEEEATPRTSRLGYRAKRFALRGLRCLPLFGRWWRDLVEEEERESLLQDARRIQDKLGAAEDAMARLNRSATTLRAQALRARRNKNRELALARMKELKEAERELKRVTVACRHMRQFLSKTLPRLGQDTADSAATLSAEDYRLMARVLGAVGEDAPDAEESIEAIQSYSEEMQASAEAERVAEALMDQQEREQEMLEQITGLVGTDEDLLAELDRMEEDDDSYADRGAAGFAEARERRREAQRPGDMGAPAGADEGSAQEEQGRARGKDAAPVE